MGTLMPLKVFIIILANTFVDLEAIQKDLSIIGGHNAAVGEAPYMVGLLRKLSNGQKKYICGGAIIGKHWILTADHCINDEVKEDLIATVGSVNRKKGSKYYILQMISYPGYPTTDLALLKTTTDIAFNENVNLISLESAQIPVSEVARAYGWGLTQVSTNKFCNLIYIHTGYLSITF